MSQIDAWCIQTNQSKQKPIYLEVFGSLVVSSSEKSANDFLAKYRQMNPQAVLHKPVRVSIVPK